MQKNHYVWSKKSKVTVKINGYEVKMKRLRKMKNLGVYIAETLNELDSSNKKIAIQKSS